MPPDHRDQRGRHPDRQLLAAIVESAADAIFTQNWDGAITSWNEGAARLFGYSATEVIGKAAADFVMPEEPDALTQIRERIRRGEQIGHFEAVGETKEGRPIHLSIGVSPIQDESGVIVGMASIAREITASKQAEARLRHLAYFDPLTGLPNRALLQDRLQQAVALAKRQDRLLAVHFLDLDYYKTVNDSLGHAQGDAVLQALAGRLKRSIRASDTVARYGGDEFAVIQTNLAQAEGAVTLAGRLMAVISEPVVLPHQTVRTTASIGIAIYPLDDPSGEQLLAHADTAMYLAKKSGRNDFRFHSEGTET